MKKAILLFSGGRDSFLSACYLVEGGFKVYLATFENGAGFQSCNSEHGAKRLIKRYGKDRVKFLGVFNIAGIWRNFFLPYYNLKPSEIIKKYGELTVSQFHCLTCRSAMYIWSIILAKQIKVKYIAEGARKDQGFVIQLPGMLKKFQEFLKNYSIKLLLPVHGLDSNWKRKNLLLMRGFVPKNLEPQCVMGVPLPDGKAPDQKIQKAVEKFFVKIILPRAKEIIKTSSNIILDNKGEL